MPLITPSETYAATPPDQPRQGQARPVNRLWLLTCLGAIDGTIAMLAAGGRLSGWAAAVTIGLTVVSGTGAWIAAREAFHGHKTSRDYRLLALMAISSIAATMLAAWLGATVGAAVTLHVLPKAAGFVLFLVAAEVGGIKLPNFRGLPLPLLAVGAAIVAEGVWLWIP